MFRAAKILPRIRTLGPGAAQFLPRMGQLFPEVAQYCPEKLVHYFKTYVYFIALQHLFEVVFFDAFDVDFLVTCRSFIAFEVVVF